MEYFEDGLLVVADGYVEEVGPAEPLLARLPSSVQVVDHGDKLIIPGLIDCHVPTSLPAPMLRTLGDAYKVLQLKGQPLTPFGALHLATLGAARALHLDDKVGNFEKRKEADFVVLAASGTGITNQAVRDPLARRRPECFGRLPDGR